MNIEKLTDIKLALEWTPVMEVVGKAYTFPNVVTPYMKEKYDAPTVYRWNVYQNTLSDQKQIYLGETEALIRRIEGYRKPGPSQQTNKRIKSWFDDFGQKNLNVGLEILDIQSLTIGCFPISMSDLDDKHVRRFIEELLVVYYTNLGYDLLNL